MPKSLHLGEFEQAVLLAILRGGRSSTAPDALQEIGRASGRQPSRSALYRTLDRLEAKGYLTVKSEKAGAERSGLPRRRFRVGPKGLEALRRARATFEALSEGLEEVLRS